MGEEINVQSRLFFAIKVIGNQSKNAFASSPILSKEEDIVAPKNYDENYDSTMINYTTNEVITYTKRPQPKKQKKSI